MAALALAGPASAAGQVAPSNASITARAQRAYRYLRDGEAVGQEQWRSVVHPDGSRTVSTFQDFFGPGVFRSCTHRVDERLRPLDSFQVTWTAAGPLGSSHAAVDGETLMVSLNGPEGARTESFEIPDGFCIVAHPLATEGFYFWSYDLAVGGEQTVSAYVFNSGRFPNSDLMGQRTEMPIEFVGRETVTTPAGTFDCAHFKAVKVLDLWILENEGVTVRLTEGPGGGEYILSEYETS